MTNIETNAAPAPKPERPKMPEQNGVTRPQPGTMIARLWEIADQISEANNRPATRKEVVDEYMAKVPGAVLPTANTQYARWVTFHGIGDRLRQDHKAATEARRAEKTAGAEAAKQQKLAEKEKAAAEAAEKKAERDAKIAAKEAEKKAKDEARAAKKAAAEQAASDKKAAKEAEKAAKAAAKNAAPATADAA